MKLVILTLMVLMLTACSQQPTTTCGNGICEDFEYCEQDCSVSECGDGICEGDESNYCASDCEIPDLVVVEVEPEPEPEPSTDPMVIDGVHQILLVDPPDVANLDFGIGDDFLSNYRAGSYQKGEWYGRQRKKTKGALWIKFNWDRPETDIEFIDMETVHRKIYLPKSTKIGDVTEYEYYWIADDGTSYYANSNHGHGWPDLTYEEAMTEEHLAREAQLE